MKMEDLFKIEDIPNLEKQLYSFDKDILREQLTELFLSLVEYKDSEEWNKLVRICEIFSIIGWGKLERVDACCYKSLNQWQTYLENKYKEKRFLSGNWVKRKAGFVMFNPSYYCSPDLPKKPSIDWKEYPKSPEIVKNVACLESQRNRQKKNPISFGGLIKLTCPMEMNEFLTRSFRTLRKKLDLKLEPELYGDGIENIYIRYNAEFSGTNEKSFYKKGRFLPKSLSFDSTIYIQNDFILLSEKERLEKLSEFIILILNDLRQIIIRKKLNYKIDLLIEDVQKLLVDWL